MASKIPDVRSGCGCDNWPSVLRDRERITRNLLKAHGGAEGNTTGDRFMASFGSVTSAFECTIDLQRFRRSHSEDDRTDARSR
jgi:class 3 adenylate cyclase